MIEISKGGNPRSMLRYSESTLPPSLALGAYSYEDLALHTTGLKSEINGIGVSCSSI